MLTAILMCGGQFAASAQAWRKTHSPTGTIKPVSSANGMISAGDTIPRWGWFHRNSASRLHAHIHALREEAICAAPFALGTIEGDVGVLQELLGLGTVAGR